MPDSPWLLTVTVLVLMGGGLMLHLRWHPLRDCFSNAWDMLMSFSWLVPMLAAVQLLAGAEGPWGMGPVTAGRMVPGSWQAFLNALPLAVGDCAAFTQSLFPPWPLAMGVPVAAALLAFRLYKLPYLYSSRRQQVLKIAVPLLLGMAWGWAVLECLALVQPLAAGWETAKIMLRWLAEAWAMAAMQIFLIRLVMGWNAPLLPEDEKDARLALEQTAGRWKGVLRLACVHLFWLLAWRAAGAGDSWLVLGVLAEASVAFATLPVVVARFDADWRGLVEAAAHTFVKTLPAVLGVLLTSVVVMAVVRMGLGALVSWMPEGGLGNALSRILYGLVLATARSWLFLTFVLTLICHGLKTAPEKEAASE